MKQVESLSPLWLAQSVQNLCQLFVDALSRLLKYRHSVLLLAPLFALSVVLIGSQILPEESTRRGTELIRRFLEKSELIGVFIAVLLAASHIGEKIRSGKIMLSISILMLGIFSIFYFDTAIESKAAFTYGMGTIILLTVNLTATVEWPANQRIQFFIFSCVTTYFFPELLRVSALSLFGEAYVPGGIPNPFSAIHVMLFSAVFLMAQVAKLNQAPTMLRAVTHSISPVQFIAALPFPLSSLPENRKSVVDFSILVSRGLWSLLGSVSALGIALLFYKASLERSSEVWLLNGWFNYIFYYFFWLGVTRAGFAIALILGYALEPATQYALLASDPMERWRRWNKYYYDWFLTYIFMPVSRRAKSMALGVFVVFVLNLLIHNTLLFNLLVFHPDELTKHGHNLLRDETFFYIAQGVTVYLGFRFARYWPKMETRRGWLGVAVTHFLMAVTHGFLHF